MGTLKLSNSSGNFVALQPPSSIASDVTLTLPNTDGDASQYLQTDGAGTLSWQTVSTRTIYHTSASLSGTSSYTFDSIPSNVKALHLAFNSLSTSNNVGLRCRIGDSGGIEDANGYYQTQFYAGSTSGGSRNSNVNKWYHNTNHVLASDSLSGVLHLYNITGNTWEIDWRYQDLNNTAAGNFVLGWKTLSGTLDRVLLAPDGAGTFDAGTLSIHYIY